MLSDGVVAVADGDAVHVIIDDGVAVVVMTESMPFLA